MSGQSIQLVQPNDVLALVAVYWIVVGLISAIVPLPPLAVIGAGQYVVIWLCTKSRAFRWYVR